MGYRIEFEEVMNLDTELKGRSEKVNTSLDAAEKTVQRFIDMESFQGDTAKHIKEYLKEVHITAIKALRNIFNEFYENFQSYKNDYLTNVDSDESALIECDEISGLIDYYRSSYNEFNDMYHGMNQVIADISDIMYLENMRGADVDGSYTQLIGSMTDTVTRVEEQEAAHVSDLVRVELMLNEVGVLIDEQCGAPLYNENGIPYIMPSKADMTSVIAIADGEYDYEGSPETGEEDGKTPNLDVIIGFFKRLPDHGANIDPVMAEGIYAALKKALKTENVSELSEEDRQHLMSFSIELENKLKIFVTSEDPLKTLSKEQREGLIIRVMLKEGWHYPFDAEEISGWMSKYGVMNKTNIEFFLLNCCDWEDHEGWKKHTEAQKKLLEDYTSTYPSHMGMDLIDFYIRSNGIRIKEYSGSENQVNFLRSILRVAIAEDLRMGVPWQVTLAQAAVETGWGDSEKIPTDIYTGVASNNIFGIKYAGNSLEGGYVIDWTKELIKKTTLPEWEAKQSELAQNGEKLKVVEDSGKTLKIEVLQRFAVYTSVEESVLAHSKVLDLKIYEEAKQYANNPIEYLRAISGKYATDSSYFDLTSGIVKRYLENKKED